MLYQLTRVCSDCGQNYSETQNFNSTATQAEINRWEQIILAARPSCPACRERQARWKSWGAKGGRASAARVPTLQANGAEKPTASRYGGNDRYTFLGLPSLVGKPDIARQASSLRRHFFSDPGNQKLVKLLRYAPRAYASAGPDRQTVMLKAVLNTGWDDLPGAFAYANAGLPDSFYGDIGPKLYIATLRRLMIENDAGEVLRLMGRSLK